MGCAVSGLVVDGSAGPDRACEHLHFESSVTVQRLTSTDDGPVTGYVAEVLVRCADCQEPFRWIGVPAGLSPAGPRVSVNEEELRAPVRPASSDPDFGMGLPGFAMRMVDLQ
jgi:hypothetical protein